MNTVNSISSRTGCVKHNLSENDIFLRGLSARIRRYAIATNMAGRGTDIMLGGNAEYLAKADLRREGYDEETINEATGCLLYTSRCV